MAEVLKILSVFLACTVFYGKLGVPAAAVLFEYDFLKIFFVTMAGGITGNVVFTYLSAAILKAIHNYRARRNLIHRKKIFTSFNRKVIKFKQRFGLAGFAFLSPMFLSTPLGAFLAERFFRNKKKIIIYFTISEVFWTIALYFILIFFHDSLKGWLI